MPIGDAAPGIFTADGVHAAALNQDYTLNVAANPALAGCCCTRGRYTSRCTGALAPISPPFPEPKLYVSVTLNGAPWRVSFAGLALGFVGLLQLNVEIPAGIAPSSQVNVVVMIGSQSAAGRATIAVR